MKVSSSSASTVSEAQAHLWTTLSPTPPVNTSSNRWAFNLSLSLSLCVDQAPLPQDDRLISCSIHDIVTQTPSRSSITWTSRSGATGSNSHLDRLDENTTYDPPSWRPVANGDTRYDSETVEVDPSWYQDPGEDGLETASQPVQDPFQKERVFRAHSQDSGVVHRVGLLSSGEDTSGSQPMWAEDLGVVRIGRHSKKSLEMLTR